MSALVNANVDGEQLTGAELASFFILLVVAGNETTRNAISHALWLLTEFGDQRARCWPRTSRRGSAAPWRRSCGTRRRSSSCGGR